jgi:OOP family OmpA-OmpF porin
VTDAAKITFDPGSATISRQGEPVIEAIAEILRSCPDLRLRIAGYTDSQGREESNLRLSGERAEAVLAALRAERVPVAGFHAQGYGEASPIASNETEQGRERNRRIEFTLIGAEGTAAGPSPAPDGAKGTAEPSAGPLMEQPDAPPLRPEEVEARGREAAEPGEDAEEPPSRSDEASAEEPMAAGEDDAGAADGEAEAAPAD